MLVDKIIVMATEENMRYNSCLLDVQQFYIFCAEYHALYHSCVRLGIIASTYPYPVFV